MDWPFDLLWRISKDICGLGNKSHPFAAPLSSPIHYHNPQLPRGSPLLHLLSSLYLRLIILWLVEVPFSKASHQSSPLLRHQFLNLLKILQPTWLYVFHPSLALPFHLAGALTSTRLAPPLPKSLLKFALTPRVVKLLFNLPRRTHPAH